MCVCVRACVRAGVRREPTVVWISEGIQSQMKSLLDNFNSCVILIACTMFVYIFHLLNQDTFPVLQERSPCRDCHSCLLYHTLVVFPSRTCNLATQCLRSEFSQQIRAHAFIPKITSSLKDLLQLPCECVRERGGEGGGGEGECTCTYTCKVHVDDM